MSSKKAKPTPKNSGKAPLRLPDLDSVVFTKVNLDRVVDEHGIAATAEGKLSLDLKATGAIAVKHSVKRNTHFVVVKIDLDLSIVQEPKRSPTLTCSVSLQGYFPCDGDPHKEQIEEAIRTDMSVYHELAKTLYPIGLREIRARVGDAGLPIPKLPLSFPIEDVKPSRSE